MTPRDPVLDVLLDKRPVLRRVRERDGKVWLGSLQGDYLAVFDRP